jgi:ketosteroid isomerase-like protein
VRVETTAEQFNALINAHDADGLAARMTEDHRFVDTRGSAPSGAGRPAARLEIRRTLGVLE